MAKGSFFKRNNREYDDDLFNKDDVNEVKSIRGLNELSDTIVMDRNITKYIIDNFGDISLDIRDSLINFADTLENTIDYIEDKSSELIKSSRDFKISQDYRDKSIEIYEVIQRINSYVSWINESYENRSNNRNEGAELDRLEDDISSEEMVMDDPDEILLCICEDFTDKVPKAFKIDNYYSEVSDWKELTVKAADILTKKYKNKDDKHKEISVNDVVLKESIENDYRDSVIDILKIYSVPLNKFFVYV